MEEKKSQGDDDSKKNDLEIIKSLEKAIRENLSTLKSDIKSSLNKSKEKEYKNREQKPQKENPEIRKKTFLDYFGNFPIISPRVLNKFNINISNFKNSIEPFLKDMELEGLYYYISIYKMIGESINLDIGKVISILKTYIDGGLFVSQKSQLAEPRCIFYGLSILSELNYEKTAQILNFEKMSDFIKIEIENFNPAKLHLNYYTLNCINIFSKYNIRINFEPEELVNKLYSLDIKNIENFDPILDFYDFFSCLWLLNPNISLSSFKKKYLSIVENTLNELDPEELTITSSAKLLLIIDLLDIKDDERQLIIQLLDKLMNYNQMFNSKIEDTNFSWKKDKIAWLIELRMVFWGLLASFQYYSFIQ